MFFSFVSQEIRGMRNQSGGDVNVEVNTTRGPDLKQRLDQLRAEYESIIDQNRREVESWFESKVNGVCLWIAFPS